MQPWLFCTNITCSLRRALRANPWKDLLSNLDLLVLLRTPVTGVIIHMKLHTCPAAPRLQTRRCVPHTWAVPRPIPTQHAKPTLPEPTHMHST